MEASSCALASREASRVEMAQLQVEAASEKAMSILADLQSTPGPCFGVQMAGDPSQRKVKAVYYWYVDIEKFWQTLHKALPVATT